jgi:Ca2+-binding RTX toxin-like protein
MKQIMLLCALTLFMLVFTTSAAVAASCRNSMCTIEGTSGNDVINGTTGADVICGLGGNDTIHAKGGNDLICGGPGDDILYGEGGNDILLGEGGKDTIDGGTGTDRGWWPTNAGGGVIVNLITGCSSEDGPNTVFNIEDLWGGGGEEMFIGNAGDNELIGFGDDDILDGKGGTDRCDGLTGSQDACVSCETENGCDLNDYVPPALGCGAL